MSDSDSSDTSYDPDRASTPHSPASEVSSDDEIDSDFSNGMSDHDGNRLASASPVGSLDHSYASRNRSMASTVSNNESDMDDLHEFADAEDATQEYDVTQPGGDHITLSENEEDDENMNAAVENMNGAVEGLLDATQGLLDGAQGLLDDTSDDDDVMVVPYFPQHAPMETIDLCTQVAFAPPARPYFRANADGTPQTIDLCTQAVSLPQSTIDLSTQRFPAPNDDAAANNVIEIPDSPLPNRRPGTSHNAQYRNENQMKTSPPKLPCRFDPNESATQPAVKLSCPICLETLIGRSPVSTLCGHLFCTQCLQLSLQTNKLCPMCKKKLTGKSPFHTVFF